jgi:hypothetical protein
MYKFFCLCVCLCSSVYVYVSFHFLEQICHVFRFSIKKVVFLVLQTLIILQKPTEYALVSCNTKYFFFKIKINKMIKQWGNDLLVEYLLCIQRYKIIINYVTIDTVSWVGKCTNIWCVMVWKETACSKAMEPSWYKRWADTLRLLTWASQQGNRR